MARLSGIAVVLVAVVGLAAARGHADGPTLRSVDCESRLQVIPSGTLHLHTHENFGIGPVTFTGWFQYEPAAEFQPDRGHTRLIKAPIFVKTGAPVTISLTPESARHAEIDIGRDQGHSAHGPSVTLTPCPPGATVAGRRVGRVTPFIGGYRVDGPTCMTIEVQVAGDTFMAVKRLPVGRGSCR